MNILSKAQPQTWKTPKESKEEMDDGYEEADVPTRTSLRSEGTTNTPPPPVPLVYNLILEEMTVEYPAPANTDKEER